MRVLRLVGALTWHLPYVNAHEGDVVLELLLDCHGNQRNTLVRQLLVMAQLHSERFRPGMMLSRSRKKWDFSLMGQG